MSGWQIAARVVGVWAVAASFIVLWFWAAKRGGEAYDAELAQHFDQTG